MLLFDKECQGWADKVCLKIFFQVYKISEPVQCILWLEFFFRYLYQHFSFRERCFQSLPVRRNLWKVKNSTIYVFKCRNTFVIELTSSILPPVPCVAQKEGHRLQASATPPPTCRSKHRLWSSHPQATGSQDLTGKDLEGFYHKRSLPSSFLFEGRGNGAAVEENSATEGKFASINVCTKNMTSQCVCARVCPVANSCQTLCDPMDCSLPGFSVHGSLQARILEQVAISSSRGSPDPGIKTMSLVSPALADRFFTTVPPGKPP